MRLFLTLKIKCVNLSSPQLQVLEQIGNRKSVRRKSIRRKFVRRKFVRRKSVGKNAKQVSVSVTASMTCVQRVARASHVAFARSQPLTCVTLFLTFFHTEFQAKERLFAVY